MLKKFETDFTYSDIFAKLGGYKALVGPLFLAFFPFFTLSYLIKLARVIKQRRMKEYTNELKTYAFKLYQKLRGDKELQGRIVAKCPHLQERLNVLLWNFIKLKFKYAIIKKLDYTGTEQLDLEEFYDEVFEIFIIKFEKGLGKKEEEKIIFVEVAGENY